VAWPTVFSRLFYLRRFYFYFYFYFYFVFHNHARLAVVMERCTALEQVLQEPLYGIHQKRIVDRFREVFIAPRLNADPPLAWCRVGCDAQWELSQHTDDGLTIAQEEGGVRRVPVSAMMGTLFWMFCAFSYSRM
jgi:hypothetical protein